MLAGLPWTTWLLLLASPVLGLGIALPAYLRHRSASRRRQERVASTRV